MSVRSFNTVILVSLYSILYWPLETQSSCPHYGRLTCAKYRDTSRPGNENYLVQPSPVQFTIEPQDLVFFDGSDISLYCETNCVQSELSCLVGFLYNGCDLSYIIVLPDGKVNGRHTLTILNANSTANGIYQCFTYSKKRGPLNDRVIGRPIHVQVAALEPIGEEVQIVNVSEGGSIELPCMKGVFPNPSNISWWWNEDQCQSLQCQENIKILPSGALALTNITSNISGDYFYCEIGWNDHMTTYNATYQMNVDVSMYSTDSSSTKTMETLQKTEPPTVVSLNATIDHVSKGRAIYYKSDLLVDLHNNVDDYLINGAITCTFSGHPRPQVQWFLNGLNTSECIDTANIVTEGNTSVLYFNTTNAKSYFGSYQCVVSNEVGYASNTTRILPKGWSNPPEILSVIFHGTDIILTWGPPEYTGGRTVRYYAVEFQDNNVIRATPRTLNKMTESNSLTFKDIEEYYRDNGEFYVQFTIRVVNDEAKAVSDVATVEFDTSSYSNRLRPEINSVDCTRRNVTVKWINHNQDAYSNIWDHCVYYNCTTSGGDVTGELCTPYLSRDNVFTARQTMELDSVPLNGKCSLRVMVYGGANIYRWSNYETCTRNVSLSVVTSKMIDQVHTAGDEVTFTCQATSELISTIHWYFNDNPLNESDKYEISTELLNYNNKTSELTVKRVESSDVGTYTCYAANGISVDNSSGVLSVNVAPVITIPDTERTFNATDSNRITCTAEGYPTPNIIWLNNNGSEVDKDRLITNSVMATGVGNITNKSVAINITRDDGGVYTCIASNSVDSNTSIINITVQSIPIIAIQEEYTVTEGGNITCGATGYPVPVIIWLNNDGSKVNESRLVTGSAVATGVGNLFSMSASMIVRRGDGGVYTCVASNLLGSDNISVNITVHSLPVISMPRAEQEYYITESDKITCEATGYPVPVIVWLNNDGNKVNESSLVTGSAVATGVGSLLSMSVSMIVRRSDGGAYTCVASNPLGSDNSSVTVKSLPIISMPRAEQEYYITESDKITCEATGYPVPDIVWLNGDGSKVNESRLITGSEVATGVGNLFSMNVSMIVRSSDGGAYTCVANNSYGSDSVSITVYSPLHSTSDVAVWVGVSISLLLLSLLVLLLTIGVIWIRRRKYRAKSVAINQDLLKGLDGTADYDKLPKDNISLVETISIKSKDMLGSMISIVTDVNIDMILGPPDSPIFSFLDSESGDTDMDSNCSGVSYGHYTTTKLQNSTMIDSAATSATTTSSTNVDSGIDSHNKFSV